MEKGKKTVAKCGKVTSPQLSLEFPAKVNGQTMASTNSRVIVLSERRPPDKPNPDYSKLVVKFTKSF